MSWTRFAARFAAAAVAFAVVAAGMILLFGVVALAIDWDIPEPQGELLGPSSVFDRDLRPITRFAAEIEARPVSLEEISPHLRNAVVATEDHRFYEHEGVDALSVIRAIWRNLQTGGIAEGGSTLTQQYVKMAYVGDAVTWSRKIREAVVALQLEKEYAKDEILERYLNRAYFGAGAYGAEAAAQTYFEKPAAELNAAEAATLAQTLSAPSRYSPRTNLGEALRRRNRVLDVMQEYGHLTRAEVAEARSAPMRVAEPRRPGSAAPFFAEQVRQHVLDAYGPDLVYRGGLHIITTIDLEQQVKLDEQIRARLPADPTLDMGAVALDPATGDILAAYSGRNFQESQVDLAMGGDFGQQTGSAFKPVVLATALEEGMDLGTTYRAPGSVTIGGFTVRGSGCGGSCSLERAIAVSSNTVFFQLGRDVGRDDFREMAYRLGMRSADLARQDHGIGMALGTADVTPLDMASAFGTFANMGVACPARTVLEVRNPAGTPLAPPDPRQPTAEQRAAWAERFAELGYEFGEEDLGRCYRAVAPSVAGKVNQALQGVVAGGTGRAADIGRPQAGKTGTSDQSKQVWFVGYTPDMSMAIYLGDPRAPRPLRGLEGCTPGCFGGGVVAPVWAAAAAALLEGSEPVAFPEIPPDERVGRGASERSLGPPASPSPSPMPSPTPEPTEPPVTLSPRPSPGATQRPTPTASPSPTLTPPPTSRPTPPPPADPLDPDGGVNRSETSPTAPPERGAGASDSEPTRPPPLPDG